MGLQFHLKDGHKETQHTVGLLVTLTGKVKLLISLAGL